MNIKALKQNHINFALHSVLWIAALGLRLLISPGKGDFWTSFIPIITSYLCFIVVFYATFVSHVCLYNKKKYILYSISIVVIMALGMELFRVANNFLGIWGLTRKVRGGIHVPRVIYQSVFLAISLAVAYCIMQSKRYTEQQKQLVELEKTKMELRFLKSQMHPHFFFNTLNNIYGLTYSKDDRAPKAVMMLSEVMRYMVYDTRCERVSLGQELEFLQTYIQIEELRLNSDSRIIFNIGAIRKDLNISPLILLPLVENCFKHSNVADGGEIEINTWLEDRMLNFSCRNSFDHRKSSSYSGVGMVNLRKQLELIYPKNYSLDIDTEENNYFALLTLNL